MSEKILVIGGAGYIGSHTVRALRAQGRNLVVLDNLSKGHKEALTLIDATIPFIEGDLGDETLLEKLFSDYNIQCVMHFAAFIEVGTSVREPETYYDNNFVKVQRLLKAMLKARVKNFVFSSTAAVFGNPQTDKIAESHPQLPINPYGTTKLMVEWYLKDLAVAHPDFHYCILRYFNACGSSLDGRIGHSYDPPTHLLSLIMKAASGQRDSLSVFGSDYATPDGTCIRDYIHVEDLADAHILGMDRMLKESLSDDYNLGNGAGFSVKEMIASAKKITGVDFKVENAPRREGDPALLIADPDKAKKLLKWMPSIGLEAMISSSWNWEQNRTY